VRLDNPFFLLVAGIQILDLRS